MPPNVGAVYFVVDSANIKFTLCTSRRRTMATAARRVNVAEEAGAGAHAWRRAFRDLPREHGFEPLRVEGRLPEGLRGTLYRTGPSLFSTFGRRYGHWFDGDGA